MNARSLTNRAVRNERRSRGALRLWQPFANYPLMKRQLSLSLLCLGSAFLFTGCAAGTVDRHEDRYDRREDRVDRHTYSGPGDRAEDYYDRRENVNDKARGRRGL